MPMSLVLPVTAHRRTKPPKESTIWYPSPETGCERSRVRFPEKPSIIFFLDFIRSELCRS
ncbi:hypothetical protein PHYBLDRAFT_144999 [Phycomyces blakesleeanus NRRL 1555(-)]|uniref:Uncharacterized protein n=1 Tax=Phycomyces blakesleeanus (strain ATCC 8743b / DSM 1359 / FGSC 10004 / NBRC 33097 / NRRL 1555) TaxID=763407 RepID=A0A162XFK4_PHYB8|nr:hypothetical protein PHYBLDRAFT_144999 [Phycomyces blakesleeanus NRRL 1555(-)]OAD74565.1 hypothetical protein PHYBLDRAFT_144999 [Phycomyces blakesleeanus NRRL 1555(-)]|eukprot:XP_018292605.1 hypothetical protein PHYBLDRAFT_144999 [Phycomyces blakesleeanus NRRL 1555(-)]